MSDSVPNSTEAGRITDISDFDRLPDSARIRIKELQRVWGGCSTATIYRLIKRGVLPQPYRISTHISAWSVGEIRQAMTKCEHGGTNANRPQTQMPQR